MKTSIITEMQQSDQVVHIVKSKDATPLIDAKYVRRVSISPPASRGHIAISLTTIGRSWKQRAPETGPVGEN